jgi:hypothetical protein
MFERDFEKWSGTVRADLPTAPSSPRLSPKRKLATIFPRDAKAGPKPLKLQETRR